MTNNFDKQEWQAEQAARDAALDKQREKERKARERSARNAQRKLERLHRTLSEKNEISEFEDEFGESVVERLDKFGSAFHDREKGRPGDALSFAQKRVVAAMNKKVKDLKKTPKSDGDNVDGEYERTADRRRSETRKPRSSFKPKGKAKFTPRIRHIEDDMLPVKAEPYIPIYHPTKPQSLAMSMQEPAQEPLKEPVQETPKRPFLRLVKNA